MTSIAEKKESFHTYYDSLGNIGAGGYGSVLKVLDKRDGKIYALKVFNMMKSENKEKIITEMRKEEEIYLKLTKCYHYISCVREIHYNLLYNNVYVPAIKMELITGRNCYELYNSKKKARKFFHPSVVYNLMFQIFSGLYIIHFYKIVHKDIKSDNIMIDIDHNVKIVDLGMSCVIYSTAKDVDPSNGKVVVACKNDITSTGVYSEESPESYSRFLRYYNTISNSEGYSEDRVKRIIATDKEMIKGKYHYLLNSNYSNMPSKDVYGCALVVWMFMTMTKRQSPFQEVFDVPPVINSTIAYIVKKCLSVDPKKRMSAKSVLTLMGATEQDLADLLLYGNYKRNISSIMEGMVDIRNNQ